ncbi:hypothetical protein AXK11_07380 [Cephaloticoccus primus]|uniref:Uncharacterized protein n=1 Tax=Cephaloticoccus primus TaxID=1548207 RepID=A0A139SKU5_9BACT|nr:hypothetical protein AXK11_07380 [Cephaloticoccus primus]
MHARRATAQPLHIAPCLSRRSLCHLTHAQQGTRPRQRETRLRLWRRRSSLCALKKVARRSRGPTHICQDSLQK